MKSKVKTRRKRNKRKQNSKSKSSLKILRKFYEKNKETINILLDVLSQVIINYLMQNLNCNLEFPFRIFWIFNIFKTFKSHLKTV